MSFTVSDGNCLVGIDSNNILRYVTIEIGGLGTRMYITKAVVSVKNENIRSEPDFTKAEEYYKSIEEKAEFIKGYSDFDTGLAEWNKKQLEEPIKTQK